MHDVSREAIIEHDVSDFHSHDDSAFNKFLDRYGEFINPLICIVLVTISWVNGEAEEPWIYIALAACVLSGYPIFRNSIISTITNKRLNAEVLVSIALVASIWVGEYVAGAIVVLMMNIGELLEDITIAKTGEAVRSLMELEADTARVIRNGLTVRQTERLAQASMASAPAPKNKAQPRDPNIQALERELSVTLGLNASLKSRENGKGSLTLHYRSLEELDGLIFAFITRRNTIMNFSQELTPEQAVLAYLWGESTHSYASQPLKAG